MIRTIKKWSHHLFWRTRGNVFARIIISGYFWYVYDVFSCVNKQRVKAYLYRRSWTIACKKYFQVGNRRPHLLENTYQNEIFFLLRRISYYANLGIFVIDWVTMETKCFVIWTNKKHMSFLFDNKKLHARVSIKGEIVQSIYK